MSLLEREEQQIAEHVDRIRERSDELPAPTDTVDGLMVLAHFGHHGILAVYRPQPTASYLDPTYADYADEVYGRIREGADRDGTEILGLFPDGLGQNYRTVAGSYHDAIRWTPTKRNGAVLTDPGIDRFAEVYNRLDDGATVAVMGEDEKRCYRYTSKFLDALRTTGATDFEISHGPSYGR